MSDHTVETLEAEFAAMQDAIELTLRLFERHQAILPPDCVVRLQRATERKTGRQLLERLARAEAALKLFPAAYPEWRQMLHEEGCIGTRDLPGERDGSDVCECDGDHTAQQLEEALAPAPKEGT